MVSIYNEIDKKKKDKILALIIAITPLLVFLANIFSTTYIPNCLESLSATYYTNNFVFEFCFLFQAFIFSYVEKDISILISMCILVLFPCKDNLPLNDKIGIFNLNADISSIFHSIGNLGLFLSFIIRIIKTIKKESFKKYFCVMFILFFSIVYIIIETILHSNGNWFLHQYIVYIEILMFLAVSDYYIIRN